MKSLYRIFVMTFLAVAFTAILTASAVAAENRANVVELTIGSDIMFINGVETKIDSPPVIIDGHTLVPLPQYIVGRPFVVIALLKTDVSTLVAV